MIKKEILTSVLKKFNTQLQPTAELSLGLDRGTEAIRYVLVNRKTQRILKWGSYSSLGGSSKSSKKGFEKKKLSGAPNAFLKELAKSIPKRRLGSIAINLRDSSVSIGNFTIPVGSKPDEDGRIQAAIKERGAGSVEDLSYFCRVYGQSPAASSESTEEKQIFFTSVEKKVASRLIDPIEASFSVVPSIIPEGYAHERLAELAGLRLDRESIAIINVGRSVTIISVIQNGKIAFERDIPLAGQDLTRSILVLHREGMSPRSANDLNHCDKMKKGAFIPLPNQEGVSVATATEENQRVFEAMQGVLNAWVQDINLSLQFFNEKCGPEKISRIYLMGGGANFENLAPYVERELGMETHRVTFPEKSQIQVAPGQDAEKFRKEFHEYATAFALAFAH